MKVYALRVGAGYGSEWHVFSSWDAFKKWIKAYSRFDPADKFPLENWIFIEGREMKVGKTA